MKGGFPPVNQDLAVSLLTVAGTMISSLAGILISNRLTNYRIAQLERKQELHNQAIQRTFVLEEKAREADRRLSELETALR